MKYFSYPFTQAIYMQSYIYWGSPCLSLLHVFNQAIQWPPYNVRPPKNVQLWGALLTPPDKLSIYFQRQIIKGDIKFGQ